MRTNLKMKKTVLGVSLFLLSSTAMFNVVEAQWSVIDVNSNSLLQSVQKGLTSIQNALQGISKNQETQVKQTDQYQQDTDKRNRLATMSAESIRRDLDAMPTIEQCVEMTNRGGNSSGVQSSGGGGSIARDNARAKADKITTNAQGQALVLQNMIDAQTCNGGMDSAVNNCTKGAYAGADVYAYSLKNDIKSKNSMGLMTNSLDTNAVKAAETYSQNATIAFAPPNLTPEQAKKNPVYISMYKSTMVKINAANDVLNDIMTLRKAPSAMTNSIAAKKWDEDKNDYEATFGVAPPKVPSFFESLNFAIMRDYAGPPKAAEINDPIKLAQELNQKITINNVVAIQQLKATENNNILLAHVLMQLTAPNNIDTVKAEAAKTKNLTQ